MRSIKFQIQTAARHCYAVATPDTDTPEAAFSAVRKLTDASFFAKTYIAGGTVFPYVFCYDAELPSVAAFAEKNGFGISTEKLPRFLANMIRRY